MMSRMSDGFEDVCYECSGLGDDYRIDENGELVCNCDTCPLNDDDGERKEGRSVSIMPTIKELNEAIETLIAECNTHERCLSCPMRRNCRIIMHDVGSINDWEKIEDGEHDD